MLEGLGPFGWVLTAIGIAAIIFGIVLVIITERREG